MLCVREFVCRCTCERGAGKLFRAFQCLCDLVYSPPAMIEVRWAQRRSNVVPSGYVSCCYLHMALWLRSNVCTCAHSCVRASVCVWGGANDEGLCVGVGVGGCPCVWVCACFHVWCVGICACVCICDAVCICMCECEAL